MSSQVPCLILLLVSHPLPPTCTHSNECQHSSSLLRFLNIHIFWTCIICMLINFYNNGIVLEISLFLSQQLFSVSSTLTHCSLILLMAAQRLRPTTCYHVLEFDEHFSTSSYTRYFLFSMYSGIGSWDIGFAHVKFFKYYQISLQNSQAGKTLQSPWHLNCDSPKGGYNRQHFSNLMWPWNSFLKSPSSLQRPPVPWRCWQRGWLEDQHAVWEMGQDE